MKKICILGSTGSIGTQSLEVVDNLKNIGILGLSTNNNIDLLHEQIMKYNPKIAAVMNEEQSLVLAERLKNHSVKIMSGMEGLLEIATLTQSEMLLNAVVGNVGLLPTLAAIDAGKDIALANKETLVAAGELVMKKVVDKGVKLYPIDSEHSAIFQCLAGNENNKIHKIYLTASGGPFRGRDLKALEDVTLKNALNHPNWVMGQKITVDSATLMNKGLEVIEAKWLFGVELSQIQVIVHPQSVIHSMVEYEDGAVMAQLGESDMRIPIQYALTSPRRMPANFKRINFLEKNSLTFEEPDTSVFHCLQLAYNAISAGGTMPAILNAANEAAVSLFLKEKISFLDIPRLIEKAMNAYTVKHDFEISDLLECDKWARGFVMENH